MEDGTETELDHGHVVIAAITSCTNTSNPSVMIAAGLLARNAVERGLESKPWVKTSLAPGSKVVMEYYDKANLVDSLESLGFHLVGYGCTTCIGNSGPLPEEVSNIVGAEDLAVVSVLTGNRNFEGRINPDVKMNYLASPPLVVAYALAGTMDIDLLDEPLGQDADGADVYLKDIWPSAEEVARVVEASVHEEMFRSSYDGVFDGDDRWQSLEIPEGDRFAWADDSTYVRLPESSRTCRGAASPEDITGARVLAKLGDSVDDRPHLARRRDQEGHARGALPERARRRAEGLQLLRLTARQPRGHGPRHLRQHPPAQPARAGRRRPSPHAGHGHHRGDVNDGEQHGGGGVDRDRAYPALGVEAEMGRDAEDRRRQRRRHVPEREVEDQQRSDLDAVDVGFGVEGGEPVSLGGGEEAEERRDEKHPANWRRPRLLHQTTIR